MQLLTTNSRARIEKKASQELPLFTVERVMGRCYGYVLPRETVRRVSDCEEVIGSATPALLIPIIAGGALGCLQPDTWFASTGGEHICTGLGTDRLRHDLSDLAVFPSECPGPPVYEDNHRVFGLNRIASRVFSVLAWTLAHDDWRIRSIDCQ